MTPTEGKPAAGAGTVAVADRTVNRMGFGAMRITGRGVWGPPADRDECTRVLRRAVDAGVNFIDTADSYGPEVSEELIAEALHPYPDDLVIATKAGFQRRGPNRWEADCRPEHLKEAAQSSLRRLKVEALDVLQLHIVDRRVPYEDSVGALKELQDGGLVRRIGVSNVKLEQLETARSIVDVVSVQNRFNLTDRASEDVLRECARTGVPFLPWHPLAVGKLAGPGGPVGEVAQRLNAAPAQVALAWLLAHSPVMLPIPGTSSVAHLEENLEATTVELSDEDVALLEGA